MKRSEQRILTTHVGSLPRTPALRDLLVRQDRGETVDAATLAGESEAAVRHVVRKQLEAGVDVGNDGEQPRVGFSTYPAKRMRVFLACAPAPLASTTPRRRWRRSPTPTSARRWPSARCSSAASRASARASP